MAQSINLIPQREQAEQKKTKIIKVSTLVSVFILVVVGLIAGYFFYQTSQVKKEISVLESDIEASRAEIVNLAQIEITARNLDTRYSTLKSIFESRTYFSVMMEELQRRTPTSISIENLSIGADDEVTISGTGSDYLSISQFANRLAEDLSTADATYNDGIFTDVSLNSVNLDPQTSRVRYFIVVKFDRSTLKR